MPESLAPIPLEDLGPRIRQLRGDRTTAAMARAAGLDWNSWWRIEEGRLTPKLATVYRIADALDVNICTLFCQAEAA